MGTTNKESGTLVQLEHITKVFQTGSRLFGGQHQKTAVDDVSFSLCKGEVLSLLGESGCGKTTLARILLHLLPPTKGQVLWDGTDLETLSEKQFRQYRRKLQMISQNPFDSLDPKRTIRYTLLEPMRLWKIGNDDRERLDEIQKVCHKCGLPGDIYEKRPPEFSGGQLQRLSIARALLVQPEILVADEIISALDVPVQNQILELLLHMKEEYGLTVLFITHDILAAEGISDRMLVMRRGRILHEGTPAEFRENTADPYLQALREGVYQLKTEVE